MRIDKRLNLVVPLERPDGSVTYVHSMPLLFETFKKYHMVLAKTYSTIGSEHLLHIAGPRVALMVLETVARSTPRAPGSPASWWEGDDGVALGLLPEMRRLSNVITLQPGGGWRPSPLQDALNRGLLDEEDASDAENQIAFFIVCSAVPPRTVRETLVEGGALLSGSLTTSLNCTEYAASLPTSTPAETTGETSTPTQSSARRSPG